MADRLLRHVQYAHSFRVFLKNIKLLRELASGFEFTHLILTKPLLDGLTSGIVDLNVFHLNLVAVNLSSAITLNFLSTLTRLHVVNHLVVEKRLRATRTVEFDQVDELFEASMHLGRLLPVAADRTLVRVASLLNTRAAHQNLAIAVCTLLDDFPLNNVLAESTLKVVENWHE